jgi:hypothetical protein
MLCAWLRSLVRHPELPHKIAWAEPKCVSSLPQRLIAFTESISFQKLYFLGKTVLYFDVSFREETLLFFGLIIAIAHESRS